MLGATLASPSQCCNACRPNQVTQARYGCRLDGNECHQWIHGINSRSSLGLDFVLVGSAAMRLMMLTWHDTWFEIWARVTLGEQAGSVGVEVRWIRWSQLDWMMVHVVLRLARLGRRSTSTSTCDRCDGVGGVGGGDEIFFPSFSIQVQSTCTSTSYFHTDQFNLINQ